MNENLNNNEQKLNNDEQNLNNNEQNLNNNIQNNKKTNGSKIAIIVCIVIILLLLGILIGLVVSSSKNNTKQDNNKDKQNSSVGRVEDTGKNSIKIDDSKDLVYDADYNKGKEVKTVNNNEGKVWKSSDTLKYPYVNINSKYAEMVNSEIKENFEKNYEHYGSSYPDEGIRDSYLAEIKYEYYVTDKILSLKINEWFGAVPGGSTPKYYIYNFNLETLEEATLEDVYKECGFNSLDELNDKINITISNEKAEENLLSDAEWYNNMFYIGKDSVFNIMVNGPAIISNLEIKTNVTKIDNNTDEEGNNDSTNNLYVKKTLTNEYGDATKTIDVYGREFTQIVGATGRENIYYINKDNQLCRTSLVDLNTQILASDVKDIQIDQYDKIHAYPLGNNFLNNIAMEDSNVIYENIN